jgi:hypothetical protein
LTTSLSTNEKVKFRHCERIIEKGQKTFVEVGQALLDIRENRWYHAEHSTFQEYCRTRWGFEPSRARQLITAANTAESVTGVTLPNERAARELSRVPPENRQEILARAQKWAPGEPLTTKAIRAAAEEAAKGPGDDTAQPSGDDVSSEEERTNEAGSSNDATASAPLAEAGDLDSDNKLMQELQVVLKRQIEIWCDEHPGLRASAVPAALRILADLVDKEIALAVRKRQSPRRRRKIVASGETMAKL